MPAVKLKDTLRNNLTFIELSIKGQPHNFLIDTGAEMTVLSIELASHLRTCREGYADGAGGLFRTSSVHVTFRLLYKSLHEVIKSENGAFETLSMTAGFKVSGIIGQDLLRQFATYTIDNRKRIFSFTL